MPRLGRLYNTLQKPTGDAAIGVSVEVRRQGATIVGNQSGTSPIELDVDDPGGVEVGDTVVLGIGTTTYDVDAITEDTITLSGFGGTLVVTSGTRISPTNDLPDLFEDRQGNNAKTNPLTTAGPFGEYSAYLDGGEYDVLASGGGYGRKLFVDVAIWAPRMVLNIFDSATADAFILAVKTALTENGANMLSVQNPDGNEVFSIDKDGDIVLVVDTAQLVDDAVTTPKIADDAVTTTKIDDEAVTTAKLDGNAVHPAPVKVLGGSSDVAITTSEVVRCTTSYTASTDNVGVLVTVNVPYTISGGDSTGGYVELRLYIGGTLKAIGVFGGREQESDVPFGPLYGSISFSWLEPTVAAAATTFEVREIRTDIAGTTVGTYKGTLYQGYMTLQELKR